MDTFYWAAIGGFAAFCLVAAIYVVIREARARAAHVGDVSADTEVPAPNLEDQRLKDGSETCFRCRRPETSGVPLVNGLWCTPCAATIHDLDFKNASLRLEDK
jgi:hypothetical protein